MCGASWVWYLARKVEEFDSPVEITLILVHLEMGNVSGHGGVQR